MEEIFFLSRALQASAPSHDEKIRIIHFRYLTPTFFWTTHVFPQRRTHYQFRAAVERRVWVKVNLFFQHSPTPTQPPMVVYKNGSSVGIYLPLPSTRCICVFCVWLRLVRMLSRCLSTKFLQRSSGGSLLRVRCWLGTIVQVYVFNV